MAESPRQRLDRLARVIRSKNAGPLLLTLDLIFESRAAFAHVAGQSAALRAEVARLYARPEQEVSVIPYPPALAIKITLPRSLPAGSPGDTDVYGTQQHRPLLGIEL